MNQVKSDGVSKPVGKVNMKVIKNNGSDESRFYRLFGSLNIRSSAFPRKGLPDEVNIWRKDNAKNLFRGLFGYLTVLSGQSATLGVLHAKRFRVEGSDSLVKELYEEWSSTVRDIIPFPMFAEQKSFAVEGMDFGLASLRVVTTAGVNFIVDAFQNTTEVENLKFHGFGTGTTAEAVGDTALVTELTTQYNPDNTRPTGSTTEGASANIYRTVATLSPDAGGTIAITEHGVFSQAATGGGTLLDRSVFSAINLVAGSDSLQTTYDLTVSAGG